MPVPERGREADQAVAVREASRSRPRPTGRRASARDRAESTSTARRPRCSPRARCPTGARRGTVPSASSSPCGRGPPRDEGTPDRAARPAAWPPGGRVTRPVSRRRAGGARRAGTPRGARPPGCARSSPGVPACATFPSKRTTRCEASAKASGWSCVTRSVVRPVSSCSRRSHSPSSRRTPGVQRAERLVEEEDARVHREGARERDALPLAARELVRAPRRRGRRAGRARGARPPSRRPRAAGRAGRAARTRRSRARSGGRRGRSPGRRSPRRASGRASSVTSSPERRTRPASGSSRPAMIRSTVDLPAPDGPSTAVIAPVGAVNDTSATAGGPSSVKRRARFRTSTLIARPPGLPRAS